MHMMTIASSTPTPTHSLHFKMIFILKNDNNFIENRELESISDIRNSKHTNKIRSE